MYGLVIMTRNFLLFALQKQIEFAEKCGVQLESHMNKHGCVYNRKLEATGSLYVSFCYDV